MNYAEKIQTVVNTIEKLNMPTTINNINLMIYIMQTLLQIRDELAAPTPVPVEEVTNDAGKANSK